MSSLIQCGTRLLLILALSVLPAACSDPAATGPQEVSVSGVVRLDGVPLVVENSSYFVTLRVPGEDSVVAQRVGFQFAGAYSIGAVVDAELCGLLEVSVSVTNVFGQTVAFVERAVGGCGNRTVDFDL